jgi:hypothetical protein
MDLTREYCPQAQEFQKLRFGERPRERVALEEVESEVGQMCCAQIVFDTFSDYVEAQAMAELTHQSDDRVVSRRGHTAHHEALIDLELIERELWQQREGGVADAEIIDGKADTEVARRAELFDCVQHVCGCSRLGDLEGEPTWFDLVPGQFPDDTLGQVVPSQIDC